MFTLYQTSPPISDLKKCEKAKISTEKRRVELKYMYSEVKSAIRQLTKGQLNRRSEFGDGQRSNASGTR